MGNFNKVDGLEDSQPLADGGDTDGLETFGVKHA